MLSQRKTLNRKQNYTKIRAKIQNASIIFFDLDGTLIDTDYANFMSYNKAIDKVTHSDYSLTFNPERWGRITRVNLKKIIPNLTDAKYSEIIEEKEKLYDSYLHLTTLNRYVADILDKFSNNKKVLVTKSQKERADLLLAHYKLSGKFDKCFYKEDLTTSNKYQHAITMLSLSASLVVVFENEESEIDSALTIGIPESNIFWIEKGNQNNSNSHLIGEI